LFLCAVVTKVILCSLHFGGLATIHLVLEIAVEMSYSPGAGPVSEMCYFGIYQDFVFSIFLPINAVL